MRFHRFICWLFVAWLGVFLEQPEAAAAPSAESGTKLMTNKSYPMGKLGELKLIFPQSWKEESIRVQEGNTNVMMTFDAIRFTPTNQTTFEFVVELLPVGQMAEGKSLKDMLQTNGQAELTNSVETRLNIKEFKSTAGKAWYFRVTDKKWANAVPPPGECKYLTQGYSELGPLILSFHLVSNQPEHDEPVALEIIRSARIIKP